MIIYRPKGRAGEYALLAANIYVGCSHGCRYCYVPSVTRNPHFWTQQYVRAGLLDQLRKDAESCRGSNERVLLCFSCDPYQHLDVRTQTTRKVIEILKEFGMAFQVLTKGGLRASRDFDLYTYRDAFAVTLTLVEAAKSQEVEPQAASPADRIASLRYAKERADIETWVSLEPVIDPEQSLEAIRRTYEFVDHYKIGKLNHQRSDIDWRKFGAEAISLCEKYERDYFVKADLAEHLVGIDFKNTDRRRAPQGGV